MDKSLVLRTIYLPRSLDERLRAFSFKTKKPKGELIRQFVELGLEIEEDFHLVDGHGKLQEKEI